MRMKNIYSYLRALLMLLFLTSGVGTMWGEVGDVLATFNPTQGSSYSSRVENTQNGVGWVQRGGYNGYMGSNKNQHSNIKPTDADLPVVKAVLSNATTNTTGYYFYYTTTTLRNVGSLVFSYTGNDGLDGGEAYVVMCDTKATSNSKTWEKVPLSTASQSAQGVNLGTSGTFTFTFASTQTGDMYYGLVIKASSYKKMTTAANSNPIQIIEGATVPSEDFTLTYDWNGGTGTPASYTGSGDVTLPSTGTRDGYTLSCWNTVADGSGDSFAPGATYNLTADITLYAQWTQNSTGGGEEDSTTYNKVTETTLTSGEYVVVGARTKSSFGLFSYGELNKGRLTYVHSYDALPLTIENPSADAVWQITVSDDKVILYNSENNRYLGADTSAGYIDFKTSQIDAQTYTYANVSTDYGTFSLYDGNNYLGVNKSSDAQYWRNYSAGTLAGSNGVVLTFYKKASSGGGEDPEPTTKYGITANAATNGTYSVNETNISSHQYIADAAEVGETVTLVASPATGYKATVDCWNVYEDANPVVVSGNGDTYTFTMPAGIVSITPVFVEDLTPVTMTATALANNGQASITVNQGAEVTLTCTPQNGTSPYFYEWYSNSTESNTGGTVIAGAEDNTYIVPTETSGTYHFYCYVMDGEANDATSNVVTVVVNDNTPTKGTKENPYTVAEAIALNNPGTAAWVRGFIIGVIKNNSLSVGGTDVNTNLALGVAVDVTDAGSWIPVELPTSNNIRANLNLKDHASYIGAEILLYGNLVQYFSTQGMKSTSNYEFISVQKATPTLYFEPATYEATVGDTFTATLVNTNGVEVSYSIQANPDNCATINSVSGEVTCSAVGTATVTATSVENDQFASTTASYTLNIKDANQKDVTFKKITSADEFDLNGTYIIVYEAGNLAMGEVDGVKKNKGAPVNVTISEDNLIVTSFVNETNYPYEVTFSNAGDGKYYLNLVGNQLVANSKTNFTLGSTGSKFTVDFTSDGDADIQSLDDRQISYNTDNDVFGNYSTGQNASKIVQLYKKVETVTVREAGWATFAPSNNVTMPEQQGVDVYYVASVNTDNTVVTACDARNGITNGNAMAVGTGVLVRATAGTTVCFPISSVTGENHISALPGNLLVGVLEDFDMTGIQNAYIFTEKNSKIGFYPCHTGTLAANKCYLQLPEDSNAASLSIMLPDGGETAIGSVFGGESNAPAYNLDGRRVNSNYRGIVIINGKKVVNK